MGVMETPRRGRPRDRALDERILTATRAALDSQGYAGVSMDAVAREAGVGKQTVYRRWARKPLLVFDAVFGGAETVAVALPDRGSLAADLAEVTAIQASVYRTPGMRELVRGLLADCLAEPGLRAELAARFLRPRLETLAAVVESARRRGEVGAGVEPSVVAETLAGAMLFHAVLYADDPGGADDGGGAFGAQLAGLVSRGAR
jgi:AcrR family transcriptional regulator